MELRDPVELIGRCEDIICVCVRISTGYGFVHQERRVGNRLAVARSIVIKSNLQVVLMQGMREVCYHRTPAENMHDWDDDRSFYGRDRAMKAELCNLG
jgi:hypothetical protein